MYFIASGHLKRTENNVTLFPYSPTSPIWCFPSSTLPALSLAPSVLPVPSLQTPSRPPSPGTLLGIAFNQLSSSFPSLGSGLVLLLLCWPLCHLSRDCRGTSLLCISDRLLAALQDIRKETGGKNSWIDLFFSCGTRCGAQSIASLSKRAAQNGLMCCAPCKVQDLCHCWHPWWTLERSQQNALQHPAVPAGPGTSLTPKSRAWGKVVNTQLWINLPTSSKLLNESTPCNNLEEEKPE